MSGGTLVVGLCAAASGGVEFVQAALVESDACSPESALARSAAGRVLGPEVEGPPGVSRSALTAALREGVKAEALPGSFATGGRPNPSEGGGDAAQATPNDPTTTKASLFTAASSPEREGPGKRILPFRTFWLATARQMCNLSPHGP
ncbi:MAG: hypothetical protein JW940_12025 [Polyangiaceae bacterium]|nr:hypothetical protein [Polyangiaceae bacterium]